MPVTAGGAAWIVRMCGKFTQMRSGGGLVDFDDLQRAAADGDIETLTPMRLADVIACDAEGRRRSVRMRWGMVPPGAKDPHCAKPHIHARAETLDTKPTFRDAFLHRRGLVVCSTFNEGREITPTKTEQYVLTPLDGKPVAIAVVWERRMEQPGNALLSFAMVTVPPNALIGTITDRMPALIGADDWAKWLGETPETVAGLKAMLRPSDRALDMRRAERPLSKREQPRLL